MVVKTEWKSIVYIFKRTKARPFFSQPKNRLKIRQAKIKYVVKIDVKKMSIVHCDCGWAQKKEWCNQVHRFIRKVIYGKIVNKKKEQIIHCCDKTKNKLRLWNKWQRWWTIVICTQHPAPHDTLASTTNR